MKIKTYRELKSKDELFPLIDQALWEYLNPIEFGQDIEADPRLKHSPIGYAATEKGHIIGFVGVMNMLTRSFDGSEVKVGGIWDVATHPAHTRIGVATALMQRAHESFQETDCQFSFLTSGRADIAYNFYKKLSYKEVLTFPSAYKIIKPVRKLVKAVKRNMKSGWNRILGVYSQVTEDRTGLVIRSEEYMKMLERRKIIQPEKTIQTDKGYALLKEDEGRISIKEIMALTKEETIRLIREVEEKALKTVVDRAVLSELTMDAYRSEDYMTLTQSYGVLMTKPLANSATFKGTYGDKFYLTGVDLF
jgi:ribosomal protein S18 acetylase RimI-like enzyme